MALEGKIVDFGVADILQLISQQQKTGALVVERGKECVEVLFWNGMILSAHPAQSEGEQLGRQLVTSGFISEQQLQHASEKQEKNFKHLGEILVDLGMLNKEVLTQILHNQIYDVFADLFQWKEGSYAFHAKPIDFNEKIFSPLGLEHILLDVLRMIDEWPDIIRKVPSMDSVFKKSNRSFSEGEEGAMSHEQTVTYKLVDGKKSVQDITDKSLLGKFNTSKSLVELLDAGYIKVVPKKKVVTTYKTKDKFKIDERVLIKSCYGILAIFVFVLMLLSPPDMKSTFSLFSGNFYLPVAELPYFEQSRLKKIKNALQIYFWEKGKYPENLNELVSAEILRKEEIKSSKGQLYYYEPKGNSYQLHQ